VSAGKASSLLRGVQSPSLVGLYGHPYLCLDDVLCEFGVSSEDVQALHSEIAMAYATLPVDYTGGSHLSMGIVPPSQVQAAGIDYGHAIAQLTEEQWHTFVSLAEDPTAYEGVDRSDVGEERSAPLSRRQMWWLKAFAGVYFPWQGYLELMPNHRWEDKDNPHGKRFTRLAQQVLPRTLQLVQRLPFVHIGRCNLMGLDAHHHGTVHRDGNPEEQTAAAEFITLNPSPLRKRLFVWDERSQTDVVVKGTAVWFNDFDHHGVHADPHFRYSLRVDGVFRDDFRARLQALYGG
jgi:hypothetical protein